MGEEVSWVSCSHPAIAEPADDLAVNRRNYPNSKVDQESCRLKRDYIYGPVNSSHRNSSESHSPLSSF